MRERGRAQTAEFRARLRGYINERKDVPCADCGVQYPAWVMDFDHVRGEKAFNVSMAVKNCRGLEVVRSEIDKCEVVCANCHRQRTYARMRDPGVGGTL